MRLGRVATPAGVAFVVIEGDGDDAVAKEIAEQYLSRTPTFTGRSWPMADVRLLAPILASKVVCMGKNYAAHIEEMDGTTGPTPDDPVIFLKPNTAIIGPNAAIQLPADASPVHHEGELAVVIGRPCKDVAANRAAENILGYTIANDVTNREKVHRQDMKAIGSDWLAGKCSPGYLPMGPFLTPAQFVEDPQKLHLTLKLNGDTMQDQTADDMIFDIARLLEYASQLAVLWPGDVLLTGSPKGNGTHYGRFLQPGDVMEGTITGLGTMRTPCVAEE